MANLKIVIDALNNSSDDLTKVKGQVESLGDAAATASTKAGTGKTKWDSLMTSFTGINSAIGIAKEAFAALSGVYDTVVGDTVAYAKQVRDLSREIGASAEDTSKLIQAADDVGISFGTLESAMTIAIRNGVNPTIDGMGKLADQYLAIQDPIDRTKFLLDNFGRSGADLAPLMELASEGIKALGEEAEATGLVLSGQAVADARAYEVAVDSLTDAWKGFTTSIGKEVIPALTDLVDTISGFTSGTTGKGLGEFLANEIAGLQVFATQLQLAKLAFQGLMSGELDVTTAWGYFKEALIDGTPQIGYLENSIAELTGTSAELKQSLFDSTDTWDEYYAAMVAHGYNPLETMTEQAYGAANAVEDLEASTEDLTAATIVARDATNDANAAMRSYNEALLFSIASEGLSEGAQLSLAYAMGLVDEKTVTATKQTNFYQQMLKDGTINQRQYNLLVEQLADDLEATPDGKNIEIETNAEDVLADLDDLEMRKFKPKNLNITTTLDTSAVDGYRPPTKTGTVVYQPNIGMNYAVGGAVNAGNPYNWQEYGYRGEVFVPSADGFVLSRADAERALAKALYGGGSAISPEEIGKAVAQAMSGITSSKKAGNVYNLTMPTSSNPADIRTAFELMEAWA